MNIDEQALSGALGRLSQQELARMDMREALGVIVDSMPALFSVDGAGILLLDDEQDLRYVASTDQGAQVLEAVQETTGHGPCVTALFDDVVIVVDDIVEDERWPDLGALLVPNGIRGVMGAPIHVAGAPIGSLNVYHRDQRGWDASDQAALLAFDRVAERILSHALLVQRNEELVGQLTHALSSRVSIERAVGILMAVEDLDAPEAFERLRRSARSNRRRVADLANEVIAAKKLP
jgi:GAF domain-containing protein